MLRLARLTAGRKPLAIPGLGASFSRSAGTLQKKELGLGNSSSKNADYKPTHRSSRRVVRLVVLGVTVSAASLWGILVSRFL